MYALLVSMAEASERCHGILLGFENKRGFGFIQPDGGGDELFVHWSDIKSTSIRNGQAVEFDVEINSGKNKKKAINVMSLNAGRGGVVARFNEERGFGFIRPEEGKEDLFFHRSETREEDYPLQEGQVVEFTLVYDTTSNKDKAVDVICVNRSPPNDKVEAKYVRGECFKCGQPGHRAKDCNGVTRSEGGVARKSRSGGGSQGSGGECYSCGKEGHFARDCPNRIPKKSD